MFTTTVQESWKLAVLLKSGLDHMPERVVKVHLNDAHWLSTKLKCLRRKQVGFYNYF